LNFFNIFSHILSHDDWKESKESETPKTSVSAHTHRCSSTLFNYLVLLLFLCVLL